MKVILLHNIKKIGKMGDVVDVADGYANGFLLPKKLAKPATPDAIKRLSHRKEKKEEASEAEKKVLLKQFTKITGQEMTMQANTNDKGHLFAAIDAKTIAAAIQNNFGVIVKDEYLEVKKPIKEIGTYTIPVRMAGETGALILVIESK